MELWMFNKQTLDAMWLDASRSWLSASLLADTNSHRYAREVALCQAMLDNIEAEMDRRSKFAA